MNNLLKVSALFFAVALASCESKPAAEGAGTESTTTTETTAPATADSAAMAGDSSAMAAPATADTTATK